MYTPLVHLCACLYIYTCIIYLSIYIYKYVFVFLGLEVFLFHFPGAFCFLSVSLNTICPRNLIEHMIPEPWTALVPLLLFYVSQIQLKYSHLQWHYSDHNPNRRNTNILIHPVWSCSTYVFMGQMHL